MTKNEYVACPLCGMNKSFRSAKREKKDMPRPEELQWPIIDLESYFVLQVREGGGKKPGAYGKVGKGKAPGSGFHTVPSESLTFEEVIKDPEYANIVQGMKKQLIHVIKSAMANGFINKEELI